MRTRFGEFTLDSSTRELLWGQEPVHLSPKALQLLQLLLAERPAALSKQDLHERLWPDTFVTEANLATLIGEIRTALGDDAREPRFIRTIHRYGYAFTEPQPAEVMPETDAVRKVATARLAAALGLTAFVVLGGAGALSYIHRRNGNAPTSQPGAVKSVAVLPFQTIPAAPDDHLGLGLTDGLITRLSNVRSLRVRPTSAVRRYNGREKASIQAGRELRVDTVVEGSIRRSGDRIRVTVQALDVQTGAPIWADRFDEKLADMFEVEDSISRRVADALTESLSGEERSRLTRRFTSNPDAYQFFVAGRYYTHQRPVQSRMKAIEFFHKAIEKDPAFAQAYAGLADAWGGQGIFAEARPPDAWMNSKRAALKALELDPTLSEAHSALATVKMNWDRDLPGAEREFRASLALNPSNALGQRQYAWYLQSVGRTEEAIAERIKAIQLDPLNPTVQREAGWTFYIARQYDQAIQYYSAAVKMDPTFAQAYTGLGRAYLGKGMIDQGIAALEKSTELAPTRDNYLAWLAHGYASVGRRAEAQRILADLEKRAGEGPSTHYQIAAVHTAFGDYDRAFQSLEQACSSRSPGLINLKTESAFLPLHSDSRFAQLLSCAGLSS